MKFRKIIPKHMKNVNKSAVEDVSLLSITGWVLWLTVFGFLIYLVGNLTVYWHFQDDMWIGLYSSCKVFPSVIEYNNENATLVDKEIQLFGRRSLNAIQGLMITGFLFYVTMILIMIIHMYIEIESYQPTTAIIIYTFVCFVTIKHIVDQYINVNPCTYYLQQAALLSGALITYGAVVGRDFSMSYALVVFGAFASCLSGLMAIIHLQTLM